MAGADTTAASKAGDVPDLARETSSRADTSEAGFAWLLGIVGALGIIIFSRGRMAVTADSVTYLSAAQSMRGGHGLRTWLEAPLVVFPPAWPVAIALAMFLGMGAEEAALALIVLSVIVIPRMTLTVMRRSTDAIVARFLGVAAVSLSPVVISWGLAGLSEVPFVALLIATCVLAVCSLEDRPKLLWAAVGLASIAPLVRYAGVGVPIGLAVWVALDADRHRRWLRSVTVLIVGLVPLVLLAIRNVTAVDAPFGQRQPSTIGPMRVGLQGLTGLGRSALWGLDLMPRPVSLVIGLGVAGLVAVMTIVRGASEPVNGRRTRVLLVVVAVMQWLVMAAGRTRAEIDDLGPRLLAPTAVLVVILTFSWLGDLSRCRRAVVRRGAVAFGLAWCVIGLAATLRFAVRPGVGGYDDPAYVRARSLPALSQIPESCRHAPATVDPDSLQHCDVLANEPWAWFSSNFRPHVSPRSFGSAGADDLARLSRAVDRGDEVYLLWTTVGSPKRYLLTLPELEDQFTLKPLGANDSARVYRLNRRR